MLNTLGCISGKKNPAVQPRERELPGPPTSAFRESTLTRKHHGRQVQVFILLIV